MNSKYLTFAIVLILVAGNIFTAFLYFKTKTELARAQNALDQHPKDNKALVFLELLIDKVLQNEGEVSFDDRLLLENAVRDIKDPAILAEWTKFSNSQSEDVAQESIKTILALLAGKIKSSEGG